jgi:hypothetical protein
VDAGDELGDGSGLVALGLVGGRELEVHWYRIRQAANGRRKVSGDLETTRFWLLWKRVA